jgi:hypothetical protein
MVPGMENLPERPTAHLRASDGDRDKVVDVLRDALMTGRLTQVEHAERLEAALMAKTLGELEPITADLATPEQVAQPAAKPSSQIELPADPNASFESMTAIFGGGERKGRWRVKRRTNVLAVFGGYDFDMTNAVFEGPEVTFYVVALFGGVNVTVPDDVEIRTEGHGIFGGFGAESSDNPNPNAPVVVLKGFAIFGGAGGTTKSRRDRHRNKKNKGHLDLH